MKSSASIDADVIEHGQSSLTQSASVNSVPFKGVSFSSIRESFLKSRASAAQ